jgi:hypothetical protein
MAFIRLLFSRMATAPRMLANMPKTIITAMISPSGSSAIESATRQNNKLFATYIVVLVVTALLVALFTFLTWRSGNRVQDAIVADANARIEEANKKAAEANRAAGEANKRAQELEGSNLVLRGQVATLETNAASAQKDVAALQRDAANAQAAQQRVEIDLSKQKERTATAERELLEIKERIKPRRLNDQQATAFVSTLKTLPAGKIKFGYTAGSADEGFKFLQLLIPLFKQAGWEVPSKSSDIANHMDIQVTGVAVLIPGPAASGPPAPRSVILTPLETTLRNAFKVAGIDLQFISWRPDQPEELVIGSKPNP